MAAHQLNVSVDKDKHEQFKAICKMKWTTCSEVVRRMIDEYIQENSVPSGKCLGSAHFESKLPITL